MQRQTQKAKVPEASPHKSRHDSLTCIQGGDHCHVNPVLRSDTAGAGEVWTHSECTSWQEPTVCSTVCKEATRKGKMTASAVTL